MFQEFQQDKDKKHVKLFIFIFLNFKLVII